jgi:hypothetical protein
MQWSRLIATATAITIAACGDDAATNPLNGGIVPGVTISATASGGDGELLIATVSFHNRTPAAVDVEYPAGCAVRLRLFRSGRRDSAFDERSLACDASVTLPLAIPAQETRTLVSGFRSPDAILGDSLPSGRYDVVAVLRLAGHEPVEISAGSLTLKPLVIGEQQSR